MFNPLPGLRLTWTGYDGSVWELSNPTGGVYLSPGVRGLTMPPVEHYLSASPSLPGSRWRGHRVQDRSVFWPLWVYSPSRYQDWIDLDAALWRTLEPDRPGVWSAYSPTGAVHHLDLRVVSDDWASPVDPAQFGWAKYGVSLMAERPLWFGEPISRVFKSTVAVPFFSATGVIAISAGSTMANARIDNPGRVPSYITWLIEGPCTEAAVGVGAATVNVPIVLATGESVTIYTDPSLMVAIHSVNGDVTGQLGPSSFAPVPAGGESDLSVTLVGAGQVSATLTPRFYRAW